MTYRSELLLLMLITAMLVATSSFGKTDCNNQLPQELQHVREQLACAPVPGFYDRPGMVDPPFLYGYLPGEKEETAAFWCYRKDEKKPYLLVLVEGLGGSREGRITSTIPWQNHPGGLSLWDSQHVPLSDFQYVDHPQESGPKDQMTKYAPLQSYYDGASTLFYREGNRWLYRLLD